MPYFNASDPLAIPQLFQHQFDIDDLIDVLCGPLPMWLNTTNGTLHPARVEGVPASHQFLLEPLPMSFLATLHLNTEFARLDSVAQQQIEGLKTWEAARIVLAEPSRAGGWLRERVKEAALEWLDMHDLIPPSMRHINRRVGGSTAVSNGQSGSGKIKIAGDV